MIERETLPFKFLNHQKPSQQRIKGEKPYFGICVWDKDEKTYKLREHSNRCTCRESLCYYNKSRLSTLHYPGPVLHDGKAILFIHTANDIDRAEAILHHVEEQLKVETKTQIYLGPEIMGQIYIAKIDPYWVNRNYLLSLWSLFVRIGLLYYNTDDSPGEWLDKIDVDYWSVKRTLGCTKQKYKFFVENGTYINLDHEYADNPAQGIKLIQVPGLKLPDNQPI